MTAARRLAAILAADVVGYSRLMGEDEAGTAWADRRVTLEGMRIPNNRSISCAFFCDGGPRLFSPDKPLLWSCYSPC